MRFLVLPALFCIALSSTPMPSIAAAPVDSIEATTHRALLISIDGLRPDVLLRASAPVLRDLMNEGCFTMWATTTPASVTLPSHVSMLTGVSPSRHGIVWNTDLPFSRPVYPSWPTLFEIARKAGHTTAMAAGKSKFSALAKPGTLDWTFVPASGSVSDSIVTDAAVRWIDADAPQILFVHLPGVDLTGHDTNWGSPEQLVAVATADRCVGRLLAALEKRGVRDSTVVLVTSDHGGAGDSHGPDDPRSRHIPWIIAGPGIRRNYDLTTIAALNVRTEDTFATLTALLGLTLSKPIEGEPVRQIMDRSGAAAH